jgi:hypothetical protein
MLTASAITIKRCSIASSIAVASAIVRAGERPSIIHSSASVKVETALK